MSALKLLSRTKLYWGLIAIFLMGIGLMAILSLLCLVTSTYAWMTTSREPPIRPRMPPPTHQA